MNAEKILEIVESHKGRHGDLVSILQEIQTMFGYLPEEALKIVAYSTGRSLVDIFGITTFHDSFKLRSTGGKNSKEEDISEELDHSLNVRCLHCNHSLLDCSYLIDERPSVKVTVAFGFEHGWFRISSLYDTCHFKCEYPFPQNGEVNFFCPHCHAELFTSANCSECDAPLVPMITRRDYITPICSCDGCKTRESKLANFILEHLEIRSAGVK